MKVAIIVRRLNVKGGTQRQALFLAQMLRQRGHQAALYTFLADPDRSYTELFAGLPVVALGAYPKSRNALIDFWNEYRAARSLARRIDRDTDILNPHDQVSYRVAYYFKREVRNIPSVWMMNDMPTKTWGYWRERECGSERRVSWLRQWIWRLLESYDIRTAIKVQDAIAVLDNRDREWVRRFLGKEAVVVRSGLDISRFSYRPRLPVKDKEVRMLSVGVFFPHRRFEDLIKAVKMLHDQGTRLSSTILGEYSPQDPYFKKLLALRHDLGLGKVVRFTGSVSEPELMRYYQESDIFVFPSHLQSWGLAVFEAMSCGLPVIVSETAGAAEILENGKTALIVPPKSPQAITEAIKKLIENPRLYRTLAEGGRKFVESHLSWSLYTDRMLKIFAAALSTTPFH